MGAQVWRDLLVGPLADRVTVAGLRMLYGDQCSYCSGWLRFGGPHTDPLFVNIDFVVPLVRGGERTVDNAVLACRACNAAKGAKLLAEWVAA